MHRICKDSREILESIIEAVKETPDMSREKILALPLMRQRSELYDGEKDGYYFPGEEQR